MMLIIFFIRSPSRIYVVFRSPLVKFKPRYDTLNIVTLSVKTYSGYDLVMPLDRRSRKRLATRQGISDAATRLFFERGFDSVTIDEIAEAADVGRKTVFNHFARKEDMFFDRDDELSQTLCGAIIHRLGSDSPIQALRRIAHQLIADRNPIVEFSGASQLFMETIEKSETLKARARAARDELTQSLAESMKHSEPQGSTDPEVFLAAALFVTTWTVAVTHAHSVYRRSRKTEDANAAFLALFDQGVSGLKAVLKGTRYA